MPKVIWDAAFVVAALSRFFDIGELSAREYLTTLDDADATLVCQCLRRLGWWIPDEQRSAQERLVWWLFRDDVIRLDFSDGTERRRIETPKERLDDACDWIKTLAKVSTIPSHSCLSVANYVRGALRSLEQNQPPFGHQAIQCGSPEHSHFDISRIRFDGECLNDALNAAAKQLGLGPGQLHWNEATGHWFTTERRAFDDVRYLLTGWRDVLAREIQERGELPSGWEATDTTWPDCPIKAVDVHREWLSARLREIHRARSSGSWSSPESYLDDVRRELRNTRRAMREPWGISLPPKFNDNPADINEAEKQLEDLIDWMGTTTSETPTPAPVMSSALTWPEYPTEKELRLIDAELRPEIRPAAAAEVVTLLNSWPETWSAVDAANCSALREEAIPLLVRRGLLEERCVVIVSHSATGQRVRLLATVSGEYQDLWKKSIREETPAEWWHDDEPVVSITDVEYRLSPHGFDCRAAVNGVDPNSDVNDVLGWVFWSKMRGRAEPVVCVEPLNERLATEKQSESLASDERDTKSFVDWAGSELVTLAIGFTDVVGSTELENEIGGERMKEVRRAHFAQGRKFLDQFRGREIKTIGDCIMATFHHVADALDFALALQSEPGDPQIEVRAGIHVGAMLVEENDVFGREVNFAARVVGTIRDAEIWLSQQAKEDFDAHRAERHSGLEWKRHDAVPMKGFPGTFTLWSLCSETWFPDDG